jgi:copper transport protein
MALVVPGTAAGHATLVGTSPETQSTVDAAPARVTLRFDQTVTATTTAIDVFSPSGRRIAGPTQRSADGRVLTTLLHGARRGEAYTVRWRATSSDGHTGSGVYTFGVGVTPPIPTEAYGASGPSWTDDAARWAFFVSLSLLLGTTGLRLLVLREPVPARLSDRLYGVAVVGGIATLNVGIAAFVMRAEDALQVPFADLLYGDLSPIATKTRFGLAFIAMTLGFALVTALLLLSWIFDRPLLLWPVFVGGLGFATGLSLSGHQGVEPNATVFTGLADWLHLAAALMWVGGLVALAACVWPLAPSLRRSAFLGFSRIATVLVAVLIVAGVYLSIARLPSIADLWETTYGRTLLLKLGVVVAALGWGAFHHFVVRPRLERDDAPVGLGRSLIGESSVAILVLLMAAVLVNAQPPPVETTAGSRVASTLPR